MFSNFNQEMIQPDRTNAARTSVASECSQPSPSLHAERTLDKDADFQLPQTNKVTTNSRNQEAKLPYRKTPLPRRKVMSISGAQTISPFILSTTAGDREITFEPTPFSREYKCKSYYENNGSSDKITLPQPPTTSFAAGALPSVGTPSSIKLCDVEDALSIYDVHVYTV